MDLAGAAKILNKQLFEKNPESFDRGWIRIHTPRLYRFFQKNIRSVAGDIDWDRVTHSLDRKLQKRWILGQKHPRKRKSYKDAKEVGLLLRKYQNRLYIFLSPQDEGEKLLRDLISIAFVRIAQKGNILAAQKITELLRYTVDDWISHSPRVAR